MTITMTPEHRLLAEIYMSQRFVARFLERCMIICWSIAERLHVEFPNTLADKLEIKRRDWIRTAYIKSRTK